MKIYLVTVQDVRSLTFVLGDGGKEKLIPLIQGPSDTRDLHSSKWLNESRKPESLLAPDLVAFTIQIPQYMDYCHNSGKCKTLVKLISHYIFPIQCNFQEGLDINCDKCQSIFFTRCTRCNFSSLRDTKTKSSILMYVFFNKECFIDFGCLLNYLCRTFCKLFLGGKIHVENISFILSFLYLIELLI